MPSNWQLKWFYFSDIFTLSCASCRHDWLLTLLQGLAVADREKFFQDQVDFSKDHPLIAEIRKIAATRKQNYAQLYAWTEDPLPLKIKFRKPGLSKMELHGELILTPDSLIFMVPFNVGYSAKDRDATRKKFSTLIDWMEQTSVVQPLGQSEYDPDRDILVNNFFTTIDDIIHKFAEQIKKKPSGGEDLTRFYAGLTGGVPDTIKTTVCEYARDVVKIHAVPYPAQAGITASETMDSNITEVSSDGSALSMNWGLKHVTLAPPGGSDPGSQLELENWIGGGGHDPPCP